MAAALTLAASLPVWLAAGLSSTLFGQLIMHPIHLAFTLALCLAGTAAVAQPAPRAPSVPPSDGAAPTAPPAEAGSEEEPRTIVTEKRERGQVTGATVTRGNNTYHLRPNTQAGSAMPGDAQSSGNRAAQWQIFEFDWQRDPDSKKAPAPPPANPQN